MNYFKTSLTDLLQKNIIYSLHIANHMNLDHVFMGDHLFLEITDPVLERIQ